MEIAVSNLPYLGLSIGKMLSVPKDTGIEIFAECGNDYYWEHWLPRLLEGRTSPLSVHAPFQNLDLSDPAADMAPMRETYLKTFELCRRYGAKHCVCHPYGGPRPADDSEARRAEAKACSLERVLQLNEDARQYGVELLVENMPEKEGLLDQKGFMELFLPHEELSFLVDTGHANLQKWDLELMFQQMGSRIKGYHVNDNRGDRDSHLHPWEGTFDWDTFFAGYAKYTPQASLVCEYNEGPVDKIAASVTRIRELLSGKNV